MVQSGTQSLDRAFLLLGLVAADPEPVGVSELSRRSGLAKSTTARLLTSLRDLGALESVDTGYRIGPAIVALTAGTGEAPDLLRQLAFPILTELVDEVGEHATLAISSGAEVVYIDQVSSLAAVDAGDWTDTSHPAHTGASGQILMADWSRSRLERYLGSNLGGFTEATLVEPEAIRKRLDEIEVNGVAWSVDEFADGVTGCAAPVFDRSGSVVAALGMFGPTYRFPGEWGSDGIGTFVTEAAKRLSDLL